MKALWFFGAIVALFITFWGIDVYRHRHPLQPDELIKLAKKRQRNRALSEYGFSTSPRAADPAEKKAMKSQSEFVPCDLSYHDVPAHIAGLLKYKKHEWIVLAFIMSNRVRRLWWNKGPDGAQVWSFLRDHSLKSTIRSLNPDAIAILHNHPNPDSSRYRMSIPSYADLRSAGFYDTEFGSHGVSLLEFICERGIPHLYYASFDDSVVPVEPIVSKIRKENGKGIFKNYSLRKELKRTTKAEQIAGGNGGQTAVPQL
jgi:hypothetical protein